VLKEIDAYESLLLFLHQAPLLHYLFNTDPNMSAV